MEQYEYEFDFATSLGDTIGEKIEALYVFLVRTNSKMPFHTAIGNSGIMSLFQVSTVGFDPLPIIAQVGEMCYLGGFGNRFDLNKKRTISLFLNKEMAKDELILIGRENSITVKLSNFFLDC